MPYEGKFAIDDMVLASFFHPKVDELRNTRMLCQVVEKRACGNGTWAYKVHTALDWAPLNTIRFWLNEGQLEATKWALQQDVQVKLKGVWSLAKVVGIKQIGLEISYDVAVVDRMMVKEDGIRAPPG